MGSHTLVFHFLGVSRKLQKALGYASHPIPLTQARALLVIESQNDISQQEIAQKLQLEPASIVTLIDELERHKLVKRKTPFNNRRKYHIELTKKGKNIAKLSRKQATELEKFIGSKLKARNKNALFNYLNDLSGILDNWQLIKNKKGGE